MGQLSLMNVRLNLQPRGMACSVYSLSLGLYQFSLQDQHWSRWQVFMDYSFVSILHHGYKMRHMYAMLLEEDATYHGLWL